MSKFFIAVCGLATLAHGHLYMSTPKAYLPQDVDDIKQPLFADGSNYPCRVSEWAPPDDLNTEMELGSKQPLKFTGSAVHGGGSCQVSITYDDIPTKDSVFRVIKSYEGGCPAVDTEGNLPDNPDGPDPFEYDFDVPLIPTGNAILSWTWFNKIGKREMYMNCAPITLTGNGGSKATYDALPLMMVANIGQCETEEGFDPQFQYAGKAVATLNSAPNFKTFCQDGTGYPSKAFPGGLSGSGSGSGEGSAGGDAGSSASVAPAPTSAAPAATSSAEAGAPSATVSSPPGGTFKESPGAGTGDGAIEPTPTSEAAAVATSSSISAPVPAPPAPAAPAPTSTGGSGSSGGKCTSGMFDCLDGSSYKVCDQGAWSVTMTMAKGATCTVGQSTSLGVDFASSKLRRHARRFMA